MADDWTTDTGLVSDYEGTITEAWFGPNPQNPENTMLFLQMETDSEEQPVITERYNCGPDWTSTDGGKSVTHPNKDKFNRNSQVGILVDRVAALAGEEMRGRGSARQASTWVGTRWFMEASTRSGKRRDTGEEWTSTKNYPSKFLGVATGEGSASVGDGASGTFDALLSSLDGAAIAKIEVYANTLTFEEWVDKVMEVDGVLANDKLVAALVDRDGLYQHLKGII